MCGPEEALTASNKYGQLPLSQGAWSLCCRSLLIRESQASFSQCLRKAYTRAKPRTQLMKTANRCSSLCRKAWRWRPQLSLYQCKQCQEQWFTCHRSVSPASAGAAVPAKAEALTQAELQMVEASFQAPGCRQCQGPLSDTRRDGFLFCRRCAILEELSLQVEEL